MTRRMKLLLLAGVLFYDYALTFEMEKSRFLSPPQCNWGTTIFLLNRYVAIFGHFPVIAEIFIHHPTEKTCHILQTYHQYLAIVIQIIIAGTG